MPFELATATRIVFGRGAVREVAAAAKTMGGRALLVTGSQRESVLRLLEALCAERIDGVGFEVHSEPTLDLVRQGVEVARRESCDLVIACGGGSAIDAGKAIAALLTNPGELGDYLEVIGKGQPLRRPSLPFIAVPTTAGTGSEVTRNAVLASTQHRVKVSLRSPFMLARLAVVDPELTLDLPPDVTARTGLDALTQLIEPYVSLRANPLTDAFCREGLRRIGGWLRRAYHEGGDIEARESMSLASLLGGLALANAGLGVVHGFAAPVGGMFDAPHGAVCAALLPHVMEMNWRAALARAPRSGTPGRYETVARLLTGNPTATAADGVDWVRRLCRELQIPSLASYGIQAQDVPALVDKAARASSTKGNPLQLTTEELTEVLTASLRPPGGAPPLGR
jgi:alcohol dehydrogenase class IV